MFSALCRTTRFSSFKRARHQIRENSNNVALHGSSEVTAVPKGRIRGGASRPHLGIKVDPNHGLWAFFRSKEVDGEKLYDTVEPKDSITVATGRSWKAYELRRKSFRDLHTLWYIALRERNLLATQKEEARRLGVPSTYADLLAAPTRMHQCRKTMARIKYVLNERRLAYEKIVDAYKKQRADHLPAESQITAENPAVKDSNAELRARVTQLRARQARRRNRSVGFAESIEGAETGEDALSGQGKDQRSTQQADGAHFPMGVLSSVSAIPPPSS